jgi:ubiquinone/menaquinone biosynthesis C-methylase UbiE
MPSPNAIIIEAWNTVLFDKFCRFRHLVAAGVASHSEEAFSRHPIERGTRVLDVGCGFGECTLQIAEAVGAEGMAVGVDCARNFIDIAASEAERAGARNATFLVADAQHDNLGGAYDRVFSRFGTMFFTAPAAALRNMREALEPGGELTMIVWRRREANPWLYDAELRVKHIVPVVAHDDTDQVHCGPGPFSMASPDVVSDVLREAGYERIAFERFDTNICIGRDVDEAVKFAMALGPAGEILRLAGEEGAKCRGQVVDALRATFSTYATPAGVWAPSSTWFVSACNPGR